jgi:hypothetical protein
MVEELNLKAFLIKGNKKKKRKKKIFPIFNPSHNSEIQEKTQRTRN